MNINLLQCDEKNIKGCFNLILYFNIEPEKFIVLDKVDDEIKIIPYSPSFNYKVIENLYDREALKIAEEFLNSSNVNYIKISAIKDDIRTYGYELKPIYFPWIYGIVEPIETCYSKTNNIIQIFIKSRICIENI